MCGLVGSLVVFVDLWALWWYMWTIGLHCGTCGQVASLVECMHS